MSQYPDVLVLLLPLEYLGHLLLPATAGAGAAPAAAAAAGVAATAVYCGCCCRGLVLTAETEITTISGDSCLPPSKNKLCGSASHYFHSPAKFCRYTKRNEECRSKGKGDGRPEEVKLPSWHTLSVSPNDVSVRTDHLGIYIKQKETIHKTTYDSIDSNHLPPQPLIPDSPVGRV